MQALGDVAFTSAQILQMGERQVTGRGKEQCPQSGCAGKEGGTGRAAGSLGSGGLRKGGVKPAPYPQEAGRLGRVSRPARARDVLRWHPSGSWSACAFPGEHLGRALRCINAKIRGRVVSWCLGCNSYSLLLTFTSHQHDSLSRSLIQRLLIPPSRSCLAALIHLSS